MNFEKLGDWCKWLEKNFSNEVMIPTLPGVKNLHQSTNLIFMDGMTQLHFIENKE